MKPNFKAIDQTDPEFVNVRLDESDLKEISALLQKRKAVQTNMKSSKPDRLKLVRK
ncbi:hypothetical protein [Dyadobacter psychrophilus]|uniref:Uncharacterized protein n=1 Tax=Dyadobacter psychrophilus TaxID=651661 RepID=A0A1T5FAS2_9BACT|nr:hypothetical protein [Dyadobacter psychrophilus]SKB93250.1 hypothetical protein SAMN05660293_02973 [Dyadobacter psychrophilus]